MKQTYIDLPDFKIRPGFTEEELEEFKAYLISTGRKAGPFTKALIAKAMSADSEWIKSKERKGVE